MLNFGKQFPFRILFRILSVIVVNCKFDHFRYGCYGGGLNLEKSTHYLSIYLLRIKKPKGRHMRRRGDRGGPLFENGRTKWTNKWRLDIKILIRGIIKGSVYFYNNFQQIVVRIVANLILTTNDITESIQWGNEFLFKIEIIYSCIGFRYDL